MVFDFLRRMRSLYGTDKWCSASEVKDGTLLFRSTVGGCSRLLGTLVAEGWVETRTVSSGGRWPRVEYRPVIEIPLTPADARNRKG